MQKKEKSKYKNFETSKITGWNKWYSGKINGKHILRHIWIDLREYFSDLHFQQVKKGFDPLWLAKMEDEQSWFSGIQKWFYEIHGYKGKAK